MSWSRMWGQPLLMVLLCTALIGTETAAQAEEFVTELATEVMEVDDDQLIVVTFTLTDFPPHGITETAKRKVVEALKAWLTRGTEVELDKFEVENDSPVFIFEIAVTGGSNKSVELLKILNNTKSGKTLGGFTIGDLEVENESGKAIPLTYCSARYLKDCPEGMNCHDSCTADCLSNPSYCMNGGTCSRDVPFIECRCPERYKGDRCEKDTRKLSDIARYILIAAACLVAFLLLLLLLCCLMRKCRTQRKSTRGLYGVENVVALHALNEEGGGVGIQTDDSFLLNLSNENGVPPKPGHTHKIMQTNDSFLLARSQNTRTKIAQVKGQPKSVNNTGTPGANQAANGAKPEPTSTTVNNNQSQPPLKSNDAGTAVATEGSLPRNIVKV